MNRSSQGVSEHSRPVRQFHMMIKPIGPVCNLGCTYCYYLSKKNFYSQESQWRMPDSILERLIHQYISQQDGPEINFSWQGGEPTLLGIGFFEKVVHLQKLHCPPTKRIENDIQTNGTLLNEDWCRFLRENRFLVGVSIDGPGQLHDIYRVDSQGQGTFDKVVAGIRCMQKHGVEFNTLTVVNRENAKHPLEVYRFLRDELGSRYLQFIPCVEPKDFTQVAPRHWDKANLPVAGDTAARPGTADSIVTDWSVDPEQYGHFLCSIFDEWLHHDVGTVFVPLFDCALGCWMGMPSSACYFAEICGKGLAFEHDGSVYACDHYVYPDYKLGNIRETILTEMVYSSRQAHFGVDKTDRLPRHCRECEVLFACNGECPKNRLLRTPDGEPGLNYLCAGLRQFFNHIDPWMRRMADEIRAGGTAEAVMTKLQRKTAPVHPIHTIPRPQTKLNAKCPCGSGRKYKKCCYSKDRQKQPQ